LKPPGEAAILLFLLFPPKPKLFEIIEAPVFSRGARTISKNAVVDHADFRRFFR
jgi:hypothetical protein